MENGPFIDDLPVNQTFKKMVTIHSCYVELPKSTSIDPPSKHIKTNYSQLSMSINYSQLSMSINYSQLSMSINYSQLSMSINYSQLSMSINYSQLSMSINYSQLSMSINYSQLSMSKLKYVSMSKSGPKAINSSSHSRRSTGPATCSSLESDLGRGIPTKTGLFFQNPTKTPLSSWLWLIWLEFLGLP